MCKPQILLDRQECFRFRDLSGVFSISSVVRILLTSFPAFTLSFVQKHSCLYDKKKITQRLEDMNFIFSW